MGKYRQPKAKAISIDTRINDKRNYIYHVLLKAEHSDNISEMSTLLYELVDGYIELLRLKLAQKSIE